MNEATKRGHEKLRNNCALIDTSRWTGLLLRGEERVDWLQGQATNDVRPLAAPGQSVAFCLCTPTGQIEAIVDAWSLPDAILMTCEQAMAPAIRRRVDQMVIMEDVSLEEIPPEHEFLSLQGPASSEKLRALLSCIPNPNGCHPEQSEERTSRRTSQTNQEWQERVLTLPSNRTGHAGYDIWAPADQLSPLKTNLETAGDDAYEIARIEAGIPAWGRDATPKTLPPELGPAFEASHVSYRKGCYVGQEILMRLHSRGHTNRTWVALVAEAPIAIGSAVSHPSRSDAGTITSSAISPEFGPIATAMLRTECAAVGEQVIIRGGNSAIRAELRALTLNTGI